MKMYASDRTVATHSINKQIKMIIKTFPNAIKLPKHICLFLVIFIPLIGSIFAMLRANERFCSIFLPLKSCVL